MTTKSSDSVVSARTLLFVPADRPERFAKAAAAGADLVVVDLEDAVGPASKDAAREHARQWFAAGHHGMVRINAAGTRWHDQDVVLAQDLGLPTMVPKADDASLLTAVSAGGALSVVALIESAKGLLAAPTLARAAGVERLAFGSIDLAAELGVEASDQEALRFARSTLVLASAAASLPPPIDGVTPEVHDHETLTRDAACARSLGMTAKLCIHPAQLPVVRDVMAPTQEQVVWAQRIVAAARPDGSASALDGELIDAPVLSRARRILQEAHRP